MIVPDTGRKWQAQVQIKSQGMKSGRNCIRQGENEGIWRYTWGPWKFNGRWNWQQGCNCSLDFWDCSCTGWRSTIQAIYHVEQPLLKVFCLHAIRKLLDRPRSLSFCKTCSYQCPDVIYTWWTGQYITDIFAFVTNDSACMRLQTKASRRDRQGCLSEVYDCTLLGRCWNVGLAERVV